VDVIRIAAAQSQVTCDPAENGAAVRALMRLAHEQCARLIQFPEGSISGYAGQAKPYFKDWNIDWDPVREQLKLTAALAGELGLWVVLGGNHRLTGPNRPHNSLYVISDEGQIAGRYDKRLLSYSEITDFYSPGFDPFVFEVDSFTFGLALCIEINFPELFVDYLHRGVDCVLFSTFSEDPTFGLMACGYAAANNFWISVSLPAQCSTAMPTGVIGPNGKWLAQCAADGGPGIVCVDLDRAAPELGVALHAARPWRATARAGKLYEQRRVDDPRSMDRTRF
jgi:predicted amidohydrolase